MAVQYKTADYGGKQPGFTNCLSPQCEAFSRDLLDEKSKVPAIPQGWGGVITNDWCITILP